MNSDFSLASFCINTYHHTTYYLLQPNRFNQNDHAIYIMDVLMSVIAVKFGHYLNIKMI